MFSISINHPIFRGQSTTSPGWPFSIVKHIQSCLFPTTCCFTCVLISLVCLLNLLSQHWVLHTSSQHSKEERGAEGAEAESHPGDGVGQHDLLPLSVYRLQNFIGQDWWAHTMVQLTNNNCGGSDTYRYEEGSFSLLHISSLLSIFYSHSVRKLGLGLCSTGARASGSDTLINVWLIVLTTIPYSSTSARRQSKKACTACFDAASGKYTTQIQREEWLNPSQVSFHTLQRTHFI